MRGSTHTHRQEGLDTGLRRHPQEGGGRSLGTECDQLAMGGLGLSGGA